MLLDQCPPVDELTTFFLTSKTRQFKWVRVFVDSFVLISYFYGYRLSTLPSCRSGRIQVSVESQFPWLKSPHLTFMTSEIPTTNRHFPPFSWLNISPFFHRPAATARAPVGSLLDPHPDIVGARPACGRCACWPLCWDPNPHGTWTFENAMLKTGQPCKMMLIYDEYMIIYVYIHR